MDGELELDLELLSEDACIKLWDLCSKNASGTIADPSVGSSPTTNRKKSVAQHAAAANRSKHKPMTASEQDRKIAELRAVEARFKGGLPGASEPSAAVEHPAHLQDSDDSDDSSSEED